MDSWANSLDPGGGWDSSASALCQTQVQSYTGAFSYKCIPELDTLLFGLTIWPRPSLPQDDPEDLLSCEHTLGSTRLRAQVPPNGCSSSMHTYPWGCQRCGLRALVQGSNFRSQSIWLNLCPSVIDAPIRDITLGRCGCQKTSSEIFPWTLSSFIATMGFVFF